MPNSYPMDVTSSVNGTETFRPPKKIALFRDYSDPRRYGFVCLFYAGMKNPLSNWEKQRRGEGQISRFPDEEDGAQSLYLTAHVNPATTYVTTPKAPFTTLGIKLNWLTFVIMSLRRSVVVTLQVMDNTGQKRRFIATNNLLHWQQNTENVAYNSLHFESAWTWNFVQLDLAKLTASAFGVKFQELTRIQISASCRMRMIYCSAIPLEIEKSVELIRGILRVVSQDSTMDPSSAREKSYLLVAALHAVYAPSGHELQNSSSEAVKPVIASLRESAFGGKRWHRTSSHPGIWTNGPNVSMFSLEPAHEPKRLFPMDKPSHPSGI